MRIVNEFKLGHLKGTLFLYEEKYTLQLEDQFGSISYKLGKVEQLDPGELTSYFQIPTVEQSVIDAFMALHSGRDELIRILDNATDQYEEEII